MSTITKDLGVVTAYGYAVTKGYEGTEEEFAELMASYATVAAQAAQSAQTATQKAEAAALAVLEAVSAKDSAVQAKTDAETARDSAAGSASSASQSASSASASATSASGSAQTAVTKANEANTSAENASQSATSAQTAKTDAQTAKADAETAKAEAETAQAKAEEAQAKAEKSADDLSAEVEQIETNKNDIANLKSDLQSLEGGGLSNEAKTVLLRCFQNVAWVNDQGQTYYDSLYATLYPPADLVSIRAAFNQGSAVIFDTDSLDTLKQYLTVTAIMSDSTTRTVTNYTLSGTLTEGTSTITVLYNSKTATFTVNVSTRPIICRLTGEDFSYQTQLTDTAPYRIASSTNFHRTSYTAFDIPITAGNIKFTLTANVSNIKFGIQCISEAGYANVLNRASIANNKFDPGYQYSGNVVTIPATFNDGSAPAYMRITITDVDGHDAIALEDIVSFVAEEVE